MSVYIKGMAMPTRCLACQLNYDSCACILTGSRYYKHGVEFDPGEERLPDCPLVPVPPHGRLIAAFDTVKKLTDEGYYNAAEIVSDMPTIIPASEEVEA